MIVERVRDLQNRLSAGRANTETNERHRVREIIIFVEDVLRTRDKITIGQMLDAFDFTQADAIELECFVRMTYRVKTICPEWAAALERAKLRVAEIGANPREVFFGFNPPV